MNSRALIGFSLLIWLLALAAAMIARPLMPIDETRYVTVAWEMHLADHWLVPLLNGEPYHHKPPLLFWIIRIGWMIFGVNDLWPRLVAPLFGLAALGQVLWLARLLWPGEQGRRIGALALPILLTGAWWLLFSTLTMFDLMMACFALLGWCGLALALRYGYFWRGLALYGLAIGLGVLSKGPAILVYALPPALLAPLWAEVKQNWLRWYLGLLGAIALGAAIGLAWALPAAEAGGAAFKQALLWGQTAGRVKDSFAHKRPLWWYLPMLPLLLLPWLFWRPAWRAMWFGRVGWSDANVRFCLVAGLVGLVVFSFISGKQPHYLLPLFPPFALLVAQALENGRVLARPVDMLPAIGLVAVLAVLIALVPFVPQLVDKLDDLPDWSMAVPLEIAASLLVGCALAFWLSRDARVDRQLIAMSCLALSLFLSVHLIGFAPGRAAYDMKPAAMVIKSAQDADRPVAFAGDYHGEYQFLGRLEKPLPEVEYRDIPAWFAANPNGWMVARYRVERLAQGPKPLYAQPKRGRIMVIWDAAALAAQPEFFAPQ
ncbi:glycosyltransferase family 39 protein [Ferrovibrio sp.]|uniref:ArnT family glycosyltransferase n=1 Tax=Ferrovibrio sp. TaxID=1917215 RepID=UPI0025BFDF33|nr:glycosyltransferase family 39 protein [Ferrovibrio sp.]MBX3454453.1 glycosyltransferase family 39 protein [Ferrovibrio sp.]